MLYRWASFWILSITDIHVCTYEPQHRYGPFIATSRRLIIAVIDAHFLTHSFTTGSQVEIPPPGSQTQLDQPEFSSRDTCTYVRPRPITQNAWPLGRMRKEEE